jgi:hypothetical protein
MGDGGRVLVAWISCGRMPGHFGTRISHQSRVPRKVLSVGNISHLREFTTIAGLYGIHRNHDRIVARMKEGNLPSGLILKCLRIANYLVIVPVITALTATMPRFNVV